MKNGARLSPMLAKELPSSTGSEILVVYEDFASGLRAKRLFDQVLYPFDTSSQFRLNMWKFSLLGLPALRTQATRDALLAAVVCIAIGTPGDLPRELLRWAAEWLPQKKDDAGALVLLLGPADAAQAGALPSIQFLKNLAGEMNMEFFLHCAEPEAESWAPGFLEPARALNRSGRF
jgi:hypothetical protein